MATLGAEMTLQIRNLKKRFGGIIAVNDIGFDAHAGAITAIIGPNGAGKTTLLNLVSGILVPDDGEITFSGRSIVGRMPNEVARAGVARTYQTPQMFQGMSVLESAMVGAHLRGRAGFVSAFLGLPRVRKEESTLEQAAMTALDRAGLGPTDYFCRADELSYGSRRRVEIARAITMGAKAILLDEPAAGLNATESLELSQLICSLRDEGYTIVLVEHDMHMVMSISNHIVVMNFGRQIAEGTPDAIQNDPAVIEAYLGTPESISTDP
jgi:branched-chain amino acid transport system ATP-binding protein